MDLGVWEIFLQRYFASLTFNFIRSNGLRLICTNVFNPKAFELQHCIFSAQRRDLFTMKRLLGVQRLV